MSLFLLTVLLQIETLNAQPAPEKEADGYLSGEIVLADNSTITGTVKDNIRKKGEITVLRDGKKTKYKADEISSVRIGSSNYITNGYTFYELLWQGTNLTLLRKANEPSGVRYIGAEPIVISNSEGDINDYFVKIKTDASLTLINAKNVRDVLKKLCGNCSITIDETKWDTAAIKKALEDCDKCK